MDFYERIYNMGLSYMLNPATYDKPKFKNEGKMLKILTECLQSNAKTLLYGDYDMDGLMCLMIVKDTFKYVGHTNFDTFKYNCRTHDLDPMAVAQAISGRYRYMVICDTASSDMLSIERLLKAGVTPIIIDHHISEYSYADYPEGCCIINSMTENLEFDTGLGTSAGALTFMLMDAWIKYLLLEPNESLCAYALVSLYSDCMDMSNQYNRGIYYRAKRLSVPDLPRHIVYFMNEFVTFNRRFIEFHFSPKINAIFRSEEFHLINNFFLEDNLDFQEINDLLNRIYELHQSNRAMVSIAADIIEIQQLEHFVIGNLSSVDSELNVDDNKLYNYTGLVANILAGRYGKTAVVYCHSSDGGLKASVRDQKARAYLPVFKQFCKAGGHNAAFGIYLNYFELSNFIDCIERIDRNFALESIPNEPIILRHDRSEPDRRLMSDIAMYNEFSGATTPVVYVTNRLLPTMKEIRSQYNYKYKWGDIYIQSDNRLRRFSEFIAKPTNTTYVKLMI